MIGMTLREQVEVDGFATVAGVLTPDEVETLRSELPILTGTAGTRKILSTDWAKELVQSPKIVKIVEEALGPDAIAVRGILFDKNPSANWNLALHQDTKIAVQKRVETEGYSQWTEKEGVVHCLPPLHILEESLAVRVNLDPSYANNGPLRVIRGSHRHGLIFTSGLELGDEVTCLCESGDVVLMKPLLLHGSNKAETPSNRRVLHIEFCAAKLADGLEWAF